MRFGLAFDLGRLHQSDEPYPYVANGKLVFDFVYFAPKLDAQSDRKVMPGTRVLVDCYVMERDGKWFRLSDNQGWVTDQQFLPALYTGRGSPPPLSAVASRRGLG